MLRTNLKTATPQVDCQLPVLVGHGFGNILRLPNTLHQWHPNGRISVERNDNRFRFRCCIHQSEDGFGTHATTKDAVERRRSTSSLNVTQNCYPSVLKQKVEVYVWKLLCSLTLQLEAGCWWTWPFSSFGTGTRPSPCGRKPYAYSIANSSC